jgi:hypothetical protein
MSTAVLDDEVVLPRSTSSDTPGDRLQAETTAVRLHIRWPGIRKTLDDTQKQRAADAFEADLKSLSAAKKLLDTSHPKFKAVSKVRSQAVAYWRGVTLPYIEPGVRLIRRGDVSGYDAQMAIYSEELTAAVEQLDQCYGELIQQARTRLGDLFSPEDYPASLSDLFSIRWDYPSSSPPDYLRQVAPELYQAECLRVRQRFSEAVELAESAFAEELATLVNHLADKLSGEDDGKPKVFRDTAVTNLLEFFDRFQHLNINSDAQLDQLVTRARGVVSGVGPQHLRDQSSLRREVASGLAQVSTSLDHWMSDRPRRSIQRRSR